jgi:hypothetical protein
VKLIDIVKQLESFDEEQTIFLDRSSELSSESNGVVVWMPDDDSTPDEAKGMKCFLDVWHAKEVIEGKASQRGMNNPSDDEKVELLIDYAQTGA